MSGGTTQTWAWARQNARINNEYVRESLAEFLGTMLLCFLVVGSGMQDILLPASHLQPVFGTVFGLMICIVIFGGVSGAHINPAVSLGLAIAGELQWVKVPMYIFSQIVGGVIGSIVGYLLVQDHLRHHFGIPKDVSIPNWDEINDSKTGFTIYNGFTPRPATFLGTGIATEIILTAILLMAVLAVIDKRNMGIPKFLVAFTFALTVTSLCFSTGVPTGTLLNPARDMSPRLAAFILGWKSETCFLNVNFDGDEQHWWLVGIFGPAIGSTIGVILYIFTVGPQLPEGDVVEESVQMQPNYDANSPAIGNKPENENWRQTVFIPRPGGTVTAPVNYGAAQMDNGAHSNGNGSYNPSYIRGSGSKSSNA